MLDYASIKGLAQQIGRPIKDLVALAQANDPFYAAVPFRQRDAEWFAEIWERFGFSEGVHVRRIHYMLVTQSKEGQPILKPDGQPWRLRLPRNLLLLALQICFEALRSFVT